jgi:hypothetical protein
MKSLSVFVVTAALVATGAYAQGISDRDGARRDSATAASSEARHSAAERHAAQSRARRSFASVRGERARSSSAFDGGWSVLIQTRSGNCEPSFRYGMQIQNGQILNGGAEQVAVDGRVTPSGAVRVTVAAGNQEAQGAGRLLRTSGDGTWRGQGSAGTCAGTWVAERHE